MGWWYLKNSIVSVFQKILLDTCMTCLVRSDLLSDIEYHNVEEIAVFKVANILKLVQ